ncbi:hypothetical protein [Kineococcus sp. G2]|uniref:hypothetical protein n=1 Tax=Kineococcus sp. G2 TaxID=3127484 RepID=UPI00301DA21E
MEQGQVAGGDVIVSAGLPQDRVAVETSFEPLAHAAVCSSARSTRSSGLLGPIVVARPSRR